MVYRFWGLDHSMTNNPVRFGFLWFPFQWLEPQIPMCLGHQCGSLYMPASYAGDHPQYIRVTLANFTTQLLKSTADHLTQLNLASSSFNCWEGLRWFKWRFNSHVSVSS